MSYNQKPKKEFQVPKPTVQIRTAISNEIKAVEEYEGLEPQMPTKSERRTIRHIKNEEKEHKRELEKILRE